MCYTHSPRVEQKRSLGRAVGGHNAKRYTPIVAGCKPPTSAAEARDLLARTLAALASGTVEARDATALARIADSYLRAVKIADLEREIAALKAESR